jgi:diketogulonate reductase-like aldo/keto reductase
LRHKTLQAVAQRLNATPAQVALAWILRQHGVLVIPKASHRDRVNENRRAFDIQLDAHALADLDGAFRPPARKTQLEML